MMGPVRSNFTRRRGMVFIRGAVHPSPQEPATPMPSTPAVIAPDALPPQPLIELDRASVVRGDATVLHELSLRIVAGQHTAILGPNGCGKSSFIKLINRELYPLAREGEAPVRVMGRERWNVNELRTHLGVVTGDLGRDLLEMPGLTATEAVLGGFFASFVVPPDREVTPAMHEHARMALEQAQALPLAERAFAELSTGEARRVLIARALAHRPRALLLDEPTAGLDLVAQRHFLSLLRDLATQGITLVLVTHHIEEIIPEIDRVVLLRAGRVVADGTRARTLTDKHLSATYGAALQVRRAGDYYIADATAP